MCVVIRWATIAVLLILTQGCVCESDPSTIPDDWTDPNDPTANQRVHTKGGELAIKVISKEFPFFLICCIVQCLQCVPSPVVA